MADTAQLDIPPDCDSSHATKCQEEGTSGQMHEIGSERQCSEPTKQNIGCAIVQNELREICNAGEQSQSLSENVTENSHLEQLGLPSEDVSKSSQSGAENVFAKQGYQSISGYKQDESFQTTAAVFPCTMKDQLQSFSGNVSKNSVIDQMEMPCEDLGVNSPTHKSSCSGQLPLEQKNDCGFGTSSSELAEEKHPSASDHVQNDQLQAIIQVPICGSNEHLQSSSENVNRTSLNKQAGLPPEDLSKTCQTDKVSCCNQTTLQEINEFGCGSVHGEPETQKYQLDSVPAHNNEVTTTEAAPSSIVFEQSRPCIEAMTRDSPTGHLDPNVIWKMEGLRHLYLPKWCGNAVDKLQLGNLINLQTLVNFPANKCDVEVLRKLTNLRKLVLNDPKHFKSLVKIFGPQSRTLSCLESLSLTSETLSFPDEVVDVRQLMLSCRRLQKLHVEGRIEKLPEYHQFPPNLAKLTLWGSKLEEDPMPTLERLPNLRILSGWQMFAGKKMVCSNQGFPKLKSLLLRGFSNLEDWTMEEGAMPGLCRLEISSCIKLKTIPDSLRFVKTLQELEIYGCLFKVNMGSEGEDFYKVQHVPSVVIRN